MNEKAPLYRMKSDFILASASPRRRELLSEVGLTFRIVVSGVDESSRMDESSQQFVERLALAKADAVARENPDSWVLGADTDVELEGEVLGKPRDASHAIELLQRIQGRRHIVWGGFSLLNQRRGVQHVESYRSLVDIRPLTEAEVRAYVETKEPLDKAGSYAIQGIGASLVSDVYGSYTNVVGLNLSAVVQALLLYGVITVTEP